MPGRIVVVISAGTEWRCVKDLVKPATLDRTPFGESFEHAIEGARVTFCHGGWGKIDAAASAQFIISTMQPALLINLGTCGGIRGRAAKGDLFLIERTIVYDILERMTDPDAALRHYTTDLDYAWLKDAVPGGLQRATILSADRDGRPEDVAELVQKHDARIVDWESGAIARVCKLNRVPCVIVRGVTDLVDSSGSEADGNLSTYREGTQAVMPKLLETLPFWIKAFGERA